MQGGAASTSAVVDLTMSQGDDQSQDSYECYGRFKTKVVGVRYYTGQANKDEMVLLVREPLNQYDRWAIRVDNVRGDKIGHIAREQACHLSPLMDKGDLRIEGLVQGSKGAYTMPVDVFCFGPPTARGNVVNRLRSGYIMLSEVDPLNPTGDVNPEAPSVRMTQSELDQNLERMFDEIVANAGPQPGMEAASEVLSQLFPHQKVALAWMVQRENACALPPFWEPRQERGTNNLSYVNSLTNFISPTRPEPMRGGILADDMGLGKTLTVISLIATNRPGVQLPTITLMDINQDPAAAGPSGTVERPAKKRKTSTATATPGSQSLVMQMQLSTAKAKMTKGQQLAAAAEPPPMLPRVGGPKATLIVCPLSVMSNWQTQVEEHTAGNLKVYQYHGPERNRNVQFLAEQDLVITTYATLAGEVEGRGLLGVQWLRLVLDEAHNVKNVATQQSQAAQRVKAERRWAVTGTPIQNRMADLYGLLSFLKLEPLHERQVYNRSLERPLKARDPRAIKKLQVLMASIALRRTKDLMVNGRPLVQLPRKTITILNVDLTPQDKTKYGALENEGRKIISGHLRNATLMENYMSVLEIILRLRQVCDAGELCPEGRLPTGDSKRAAGATLSAEDMSRLLKLLSSGCLDECSICLSQMTLPVVTRCGHVFCKMCIESVIVRSKAVCPLCRSDVNPADLVEAPMDNSGDATQTGTSGNGVALSAKVVALMEQLKRNQQMSEQAGGAPIKAVVFSQFTGMLNLVESAVAAEGVRYCRLDGSTSAKARADMVRAFAGSAPDTPLVFLVSLKAGGVGMNLTAASQVHMMDPWWNPSVEEQAMDRVHRLGQVRDVEVYRYIAADTIEERMLALQERKRSLSNAAFDKRSAEDNRQMRIDDVKLLMEI